MYATKRHGSLTYADGGSLSYTFADVGDFQFGPLGNDQRDALVVMNRGSFGAWVDGDDVPIDFSFSVNMKGEKVTDASVQRVMDAIRWTGTWDNGTTTNPGGFGPKVGTLTYTLTVNGTTSTIPIVHAKMTAQVNESGQNTIISVTGQGFLGDVSAT